MTIRVLIWHEHRHEQTNKLVQRLYPKGMDGALKKGFAGHKEFKVETARLDDDAEHGLSQKRLNETDVLIWWGHAAHGDVKDHIVERVAKRVHEGMGLIVLHSGHYSKIFKKLMGTPCSLKWREAGENERIWIINPNHPIAEGLPELIFIEHEEMYGEPFSIPEPLETVMISWFEGGEVFRSGVTYRRGAGNIFYFRPGHEAYPTYHNKQVLQVIRNAARWAYNPAKPWKGIHAAPNVPHDKAPVPLKVKGPTLHAPGEEGFK
ncbi:MAG: ThuA domain-containing protein [Pseudomonadota bacterium]|nr:ThuA domain-containing protein [Pseudomonadota bacterium]